MATAKHVKAVGPVWAEFARYGAWPRRRPPRREHGARAKARAARAKDRAARAKSRAAAGSGGQGGGQGSSRSQGSRRSPPRGRSRPASTSTTSPSPATTPTTRALLPTSDAEHHVHDNPDHHVPGLDEQLTVGPQRARLAPAGTIESILRTDGESACSGRFSRIARRASGDQSAGRSSTREWASVANAPANSARRAGDCCRGRQRRRTAGPRGGVADGPGLGHDGPGLVPLGLAQGLPEQRAQLRPGVRVGQGQQHRERVDALGQVLAGGLSQLRLGRRRRRGCRRAPGRPCRSSARTAVKRIDLGRGAARR